MLFTCPGDEAGNVGVARLRTPSPHPRQFRCTPAAPEYLRFILFFSYCRQHKLMRNRLRCCTDAFGMRKGMMCREMLEFRDNIPARRHKPHRRRIIKNGKKIPLISCRGTGQRFNRMVSAFTRYCLLLLVLMVTVRG